MKRIEGLDTIIRYASLLKEVNLDSLSEQERSKAYKLASDIHILAAQAEAKVLHTLTVDERLIMDQAQAAWAQFARLKGYNPDAKFKFQEWVMRYDCDGILLAGTLQESLDWLTEQLDAEFGQTQPPARRQAEE